MARYVKCVICGEQIDKNEDDFEPYQNRYVHLSCLERKKKDQAIVEQIHAKMSVLLGATYSKTKIDRTISTFVKKGYTREGIYNALCYWYDVRGESPEKANGGITIVDYIYEDAEKYYAGKEVAQALPQANPGNVASLPKRECEKPPRIRKPRRSNLFYLD